MNGRTAKLINRLASSERESRNKWKRRWNEMPRDRRHGLRLALRGVLRATGKPLPGGET